MQPQQRIALTVVQGHFAATLISGSGSLRACRSSDASHRPCTTAVQAGPHCRRHRPSNPHALRHDLAAQHVVWTDCRTDLYIQTPQLKREWPHWGWRLPTLHCASLRSDQIIKHTARQAQVRLMFNAPTRYCQQPVASTCMSCHHVHAMVGHDWRNRF